jgi:hypothetical protein
VLRRIFGPKTDEVTRGWRGLHNEELRNLYSSPNATGKIKSRRLRWTGNVSRIREKRNAWKLLGKQEGRRPLGRPKTWVGG